MHVLSLIVDLLHHKGFGLHAVHPFRYGVNGVAVGLAGGGVDDQHAVGLREIEQPAVLVGGQHPVGHAVVVQLEGVIRQSHEQAAAEQAHVAV